MLLLFCFSFAHLCVFFLFCMFVAALLASLLLVCCFSLAFLLFLFRSGVSSFVSSFSFLSSFASFAFFVQVFPVVFVTFHLELHIAKLIAVCYKK